MTETSSVRRLLARRAALGVRARSALLAALAVAVALSLGALLLLGLYRNRLVADLDTSLLQQANDRARLVEQGSDPTTVIDVLIDESLVWIGSNAGQPVATSGAIRPLENPVPPTIGSVVTVDLLVEERHHSGNDAEDSAEDGAEDSEEDDEEEGPEIERMTIRLASADAGSDQVVLVGAETERINQAVGQLAGLFLAAVPMVVLLVGVLTWLTTGRALTSVERIRLRAGQVGGSSLSERVPVPEPDDEVRRLALTMNEMLTRLEEHQRSLHRFTADASHELKSPVANLRALVDTADLDDGRWPDLADNLRAEADRLRDLVDNLLYLATDTGEAAAPTTTVHLDDLLFDEAELLAATNRVKVSIEGVSPTPVVGNLRDLQRLVRNLVDNAARHADDTVSLACRQTDQGAVLQIVDDGPGIPEGDRERIFERFTRLDDARARDTGGTGLGLPIVRRIADDHDADVVVADGPDGGTAIEVWFRS